MSRESMWETVRMAWAMLSGHRKRDVHAGRPREQKPPVADDTPPLSKEGFAEEALPWLDAVYRFSLRLTNGDRDAAEDLAQETFLRAHRFWHTYESGTRVKSWLFTICRNTYLHERDRARNRRERPRADLDPRTEELASASAFQAGDRGPEREFFDALIDDEVVAAIDNLPEEFREVLVLSDLGDLQYAEIAEVLDVPVGTVKSRLFRARKLLQERLRDFAIRSGYGQENA
jgi:RNA polymerase sigma-70 factor, ECF subfamily